MKNIRNYITSNLEEQSHCHGGIGILKHAELFSNADFNTNIKFLKYMELPAGTSIGVHKHGDNEELYIILEGTGVMTIEKEVYDVRTGDIILNKPYGVHGLLNNSSSDMKILVIEVIA